MPVTVKQLLSTWTARWQQSTEPERLVALLLMATLLIATLWITIAAPQRQALARAELAYQKERELSAAIIKLPKASDSPSTTARTSDSLSGLLTRSSSEARLNLERMDTDDGGQTNLSLNGLLENLIPWLDQLSQLGVTVRALSLGVNSDQQLSVQLTIEPL